MPTGATSGKGLALGNVACAVAAAGPARAAANADLVAARIIAGLASRAAAAHGEARLLLTRRVEALSAELAAATSPVGPAEQVAAAAAARSLSLAGLSELVDRLGRSPAPQAPAFLPTRPDAARLAAVPGIATPASAAPPTSLRAVTAFKSTWSRLRAEQRLRQALAQVPAMAGPLNSAHVVARALQAMRELSPEYLHACMAHIDTLLWLDQASGAGEGTPRSTAHAEAKRRTGARSARKG